MKNFRFKKFVSIVTSVAMIASAFIYFPFYAKAAAVTSFKDTLSRIDIGTVSNHTIMFDSPTGVASGATIILTFDNSTAIPVAWDFEDADVSYEAAGGDGICDTGDTHVVLAAAPSGATAGIVDTSTLVITYTNGTTVIPAGAELCFEFGTNAENVVTGIEQITNGSGATTKLVLSGTFGDSGTAAMGLITDDQVVITATVDSSISVAINDNAIGFGTLTSANAVYATANAAGSASDAVAHTVAVGTNATGGYALSYSGATLTSGGNTIDVASITNDDNGTAGTEQFGLSITRAGGTGNCTITSGYDNATPADWTWLASTTTTICNNGAPTATETISMHYIANIAAITEAGAYSTTVTYIATGTF